MHDHYQRMAAIALWSARQCKQASDMNTTRHFVRLARQYNRMSVRCA